MIPVIAEEPVELGVHRRVGRQDFLPVLGAEHVDKARCEVILAGVSDQGRYTVFAADTAGPQVPPQAPTHERERIGRHVRLVKGPVHHRGEHGLEVGAHGHAVLDQQATLARTVPRDGVPSLGQGIVRPVLEHLLTGTVETPGIRTVGRG